jgi:hypothetical protein
MGENDKEGRQRLWLYISWFATRANFFFAQAPTCSRTGGTKEVQCENASGYQSRASGEVVQRKRFGAPPLEYLDYIIELWDGS